MKKSYCPHCNKMVVISTRPRKEKYKVQKRSITINAIVAICKKCKEILFHEELDEKNLELVYTKYRSRYGEEPTKRPAGC